MAIGWLRATVAFSHSVTPSSLAQWAANHSTHRLLEWSRLQPVTAIYLLQLMVARSPLVIKQSYGSGVDDFFEDVVGISASGTVVIT